MRKKAAGILKAVWTIVISVTLISAGLMCLSLQKQVEELSRLPKTCWSMIGAAKKLLSITALRRELATAWYCTTQTS